MLGVSPLQGKKWKITPPSHELIFNALHTGNNIIVQKSWKFTISFQNHRLYQEPTGPKLGLFEHISMHFFAESNQI